MNVKKLDFDHVLTIILLHNRYAQIEIFINNNFVYT
jgi:hypothetical protein